MTERVGHCLPAGSITARSLSILLALAFPCALSARAAQQISIGETSLDFALTELARQSATEIASTEVGLHQVRVHSLKGRMSVREALDRLLHDTGFQAVAIGEGYRIERARIVRRPSPPPKPVPATPVETIVDDIIVTASKQEVKLLRFPASVIISIPRSSTLLSEHGQDLSGFAADTPVLQSTELGKGRDKIFIRGVADSSFNGATQSTASVYFDDVQLAYSGPQPDLAIQDVERVEVMEGPQGTLYGAGAIGGIIRVTSNPVDLTRETASAGIGTTITRGGSLGGDANAMLNMPIMPGVAGLRLVAYGERLGGTITDVRRMANNINTSDTYGGRATLRIDPGSDWSINLGATGQRIRAADGQYAEQGIGDRARASAIAQPFGSDMLAFRVRVSKRWSSGIMLTAVTGLSLRHLSDTFDATSFGGPTGEAQYQDIRDSRLFTAEARLSRSLPSGASWLMGATYLENRDIQTRTFGPPAAPNDIIGVTNATLSASAFGEATVPLFAAFSVTAGARLTHARIDGEPSSNPTSGSFVRGNSTTRVDPTVAFSWVIAPRAAVFGRFQTGYRTGGLAVARGVGRVSDFRSDTIRMGETGVRVERSGTRGVALTMAASYAEWTDIQADLINRRGQPYTLNIGNAKILTVESSGDWVPFRGLHVTGAILFTQNRFDGTVPGTTTSLTNQHLPETPAFAGNATIEHRWAAGADGEARVSGTLRYVGRSVLGPGSLLEISQGGYTVFGAAAGWRRRQLDISLSIDNLTNSAANRFSFGNPFDFAARNEVTPLEPFRMRIGMGYVW